MGRAPDGVGLASCWGAAFPGPQLGGGAFALIPD